MRQSALMGMRDWLGLSAKLPPLERSGPPATTMATPATVGYQPMPYLSGNTIVGLSAVWRCVTLIANVIAGMPWSEWRGDDQLVPSRLVRRPMATMSRREWTWRVVATEALYNTAYLLHVGGADSEGTPWSLMPLPPDTITGLDADPWGLMPATEYLVAGRRVSVDQLSIARYAPWPNVPDGLAGLMQLARREFQAYLAADNAMSRYWMNGGPTVTVLTTPQKIDDGEADRVSARWDAKRAQGGTAVLSSGATAAPFGADPTTESAVEARREIVADVGRYFGVPTRILNAPAGDSETYSNVEFDALDLMRYTLRGYIDPVQDVVSEAMPGDRVMRIDPTQFVSGDLATRATAYSTLVDAGIVTAPEARVRGFGLAPTPAQAQDPNPDALPGAVNTVDETGGVSVSAELR